MSRGFGQVNDFRRSCLVRARLFEVRPGAARQLLPCLPVRRTSRNTNQSDLLWVAHQVQQLAMVLSCPSIYNDSQRLPAEAATEASQQLLA